MKLNKTAQALLQSLMKLYKQEISVLPHSIRVKGKVYYLNYYACGEIYMYYATKSFDKTLDTKDVIAQVHGQDFIDICRSLSQMLLKLKKNKNI